MTRIGWTPLLALCGVLTGSATVQAADWELVWADEFQSSQVDRRNWNYDTGGGGWGNNELQYYTDRTANSFIADLDPTTPGLQGALVIEARQEKYRNRAYTSARLKTQGLWQWTYGRVEARIRIPRATGAWPAFWMLGANFPQVGWPDCGELDILEWVPALGDTTRGSAHGPGYSGAFSSHNDWPGPVDGGFHVYAIEWGPAEVRWYANETLYHMVTPETVPGPWVFDHPFFVILNLAIGGDWPGPPDRTTPFPLQMVVDYVRVYQQPVPPPPGSQPIGVGSIVMSSMSRGPNWEAVATVQIVDETGQPVGGAVVRGAWSGLIDVGVTERTTDSGGFAVLNSGKVRSSGTIRFCVVDVAKPGSVYIAGSPPDCAEVTN